MIVRPSALRFSASARDALDRTSLASGVRHFGKQEQPVALVDSPKATGPESEGQDSVTNCLKFASESSPRPGSIPSHSAWILAHHNARAQCINNADELTAEALVPGVIGLPGCAILLAGIAAAHDVNIPRTELGRRECSHVSMAANFWPVFFENSCCIVINLDLPRTLEASSLKPKVYSARPGK